MMLVNCKQRLQIQLNIKLNKLKKVEKGREAIFGGGTPIRIITILHQNDTVPHMKGNKLK